MATEAQKAASEAATEAQKVASEAATEAKKAATEVKKVASEVASEAIIIDLLANLIKKKAGKIDHREANTEDAEGASSITKEGNSVAAASEAATEVQKVVSAVTSEAEEVNSVEALEEITVAA